MARFLVCGVAHDPTIFGDSGPRIGDTSHVAEKSCPRMKLTAVAIRAAKPRNKADKLLDGAEVCTWMEVRPPFSRMSDVVALGARLGLRSQPVTPNPQIRRLKANTRSLTESARGFV